MKMHLLPHQGLNAFIRLDVEKTKSIDFAEPPTPMSFRFGHTLLGAFLQQESGITYAKAFGLELVHSQDPELWTSDDPDKILMRQVRGSISEHGHRKTCKSLRDARDRKRKTSKHRRRSVFVL